MSTEAVDRRHGLAWIMLAALAMLQITWFAWYLTVPLPNAQAAQTTLPDGSTRTEPIRRGYLLLQALPQVVPGTDWDESLLGVAVDNLRHIENLGDRLPILVAAFLIAGAGVGLGRLVLRFAAHGIEMTAWVRLALAFGVGLSLLAAATLALGRLGWLSPWPTRIGLTTLALAGLLDSGPRLKLPRVALNRQALWLLPFVPFLILMILGAMQPSLDFDALEYHLQGPKEWYQTNQIQFLSHNVYTTMPFAIEMLHLLGMTTLDDWWHGALVGQFVLMLFAPMAAILIGSVAARLAGPRAGWVAALVYIGTPWIYRLSVYAYVEGPLAYYHAALIWAIASQQRGLAPRSSEVPVPFADSTSNAPKIALLIGLAAGGAMACKYPALISAVIPAALACLLLAVRKRSLIRIPLLFAFGLTLTIGPWLLKNQLDHGNPVYPLGYSVVGGTPWSAARETKWQAAHGRRPITAPELIAGLSDVAGRNDWQSPLYFALGPLAFLRRGSRRAAGWLVLYSVYIFMTWWLLTHRLDRFWVPILPALAILAGLGAAWSLRRGWSVLLGLILTFGLFTTWIYDTTALAALNRWTDSLDTLRRDVPPLASPSLTWLDRKLPPDAKVLLVGPAGVFHIEHPIVYNTVFDDETIEHLAAGRTPAEIASALRERGITHVWVDWSEIKRYRSPGNYGYTDFVTPEIFQDLVDADVLRPLVVPVPEKAFYRVL